MKKTGATRTKLCSISHSFSLCLVICCIQIWALAPGSQASHGVETNLNRHQKLPPKIPPYKLKAVNLGGWLVTEGWIYPPLFDGIPNKDLLDGTQIQLKSVTTGKYVSALNGGGSILVANQPVASGFETFKLWRIDENTFNFRVYSNKSFVGLRTYGGRSSLVAMASKPGPSETFKIFRKFSKADNTSRVRIQAPNGFFLQAKTKYQVTADYEGHGGWGNDNPSVFIMNIVRTLQGEYQVTNGYGPEKAPQVMREHWRTYIVEEDFKFIAENGLNAVRIPVGWWIASGPNPPKPFVGGSLEALDKALYWAQKYGIKVIIDLHAAPGSQNGEQHGASRDGSLDWGKTEDTIQQSVDVIEFLTARYASNPQLYAMELLNEPQWWGVNLTTLIKYYRLGYNAVRKHSLSAYVIMSNRLGPDFLDTRELFPLAKGLKGTVIDIHYYNMFDKKFDNMTTVEQNIDFIYKNRSSEVSYVTTPDGPPIFIGEWTAEWNVVGGTKEDYQRFAKAQLEVFGRASFGWAYWTLKNANNHWSLKWMIENGYIKLSSTHALYTNTVN